MNEARHEAYLNLIDSLLTCTNIEAANQILQNNSELVDTELVQVMTLVAESQRENDNQDAAYILTEFARQIAELLAATLDKSQLQFLIKLLQATLESKGNIHVIYTTLRDNLNLVNDNFAVVLRNWAAETLPNLDDQSTRTIIQAIINFSDLMPYYPLGNHASNLEIAIAG